MPHNIEFYGSENMEVAEVDATLLDELSCYIGEEDAETVWSILATLEAPIRVVQTEKYFVLMVHKNLSSQEYGRLTSLLQSRLESIPPSEGRAVYLKLGDDHAIVAHLHGLSFTMIVVARGEVCGEGAGTTD